MPLKIKLPNSGQVCAVYESLTTSGLFARCRVALNACPISPRHFLHVILRGPTQKLTALFMQAMVLLIIGFLFNLGPSPCISCIASTLSDSELFS